MTDDETLGRRAAAGDAAAFAALVRQHETKVRRFLGRFAGGAGADDIAQETFIKAWRMRAAWRGEGRYGAWLMRIAWTSFLSARRAGQRQKARESEAFEAAEALDKPSLDARMDIARALEALDERERAAAMLCFAEGYSHREAAHIMGVPLGTLKSVVARARSRLSEALEDRNV